MDEEVVVAATQPGSGGAAQRYALQGVVDTVESSLGASYRDACEHCLPGKLPPQACTRRGDRA